jgi:hypothetical protein
MTERHNRRSAPTPEPLVASITFSNMVHRKTATVSLAGGPISTPVIFAVRTAAGGTYTQTVTTDASGAASINLVPDMVGTPTVTVTQASATTLASGSAFVSGN